MTSMDSLTPPIPQVPRHIQSLKPYVPGKPIEQTQKEYRLKKVIKLASNENPLGPSPRALLAMRKGLRDLHLYPDSSGPQLVPKISKKLGVSPEQIFLGCGSNEIIDLLIRTYCVPGDAILTTQAAFIAYRICAQIHGVSTIEVPLTNRLAYQADELLRKIREEQKVKIVFLANPNNPTGSHFTKDEVEAILTEVSKRRSPPLVVLDYAYWEYVNPKQIPDPIPYLRTTPQLVILRTFSKIFGLAGLRIGFSVASKEITGHLQRVRQPFNVNSPALAAAEAAWQDRGFVQKSKRCNDQGLRYWESQLKKNDIPFVPSQGNFILINTREGLGKVGGEIFDRCLRKGIIFRPVSNYQLPDWLRISVGTPAENRAAMKALLECREVS